MTDKDPQNSDNISFGIGLFPWGKEPPEFEELVRAAERAEELGYDAIHVPYHLTFPSETWIFPEFGNEVVYDLYTLTAALAARTDEIRIALNATIPTFHDPYRLARMLTTIDHISDGRLVLGVAPGWIEKEFEILDIPFEERAERFEENLETVLDLFTEETVQYEIQGKQHTDVTLEPKPVQEPHPPVWYGGTSRPAVRRAAKYGDYLCLFCKDIETRQMIADRFKRDLEKDSERYGRDVNLALYTYGAVLESEADREAFLPHLDRSMSGYPAEENIFDLSIVGDAEECIESVQGLADVGVSYFVLDFNSHGLESVDTLIDRMETFDRDVKRQFE